MRREYHENTDSILVCFEAGSACDDIGCPTPFWRCRVAYTWSEYSQAYWVYSVQVVGFGVTDEKVTREIEMASLQEVDNYIGYLKSLETCFKKVYGE